MQFSRLYSFLFFLIAVGLFAHAKPIDNGLAVREDSGDILARGACGKHTEVVKPYSHHPPISFAGCCEDFKGVLLDLKVKIEAIVWVDAHEACNEVVAALGAAVDLIVKIDLKTSCGLFEILAIVNIIVEIILVCRFVFYCNPAMINVSLHRR